MGVMIRHNKIGKYVLADEAEVLVLKVMRGNFQQMCSYCGWLSEVGQWDELQKHIKTCEKHPLFKAEARIKELNEENFRLTKELALAAKDIRNLRKTL